MVRTQIYDFANLPQSTFLLCSGLLLLALMLIIKLQQNEFSFHLNVFHFPLTAILLWSCLSLLWAVSIYEGFLVCMWWGAGFLFFCLISETIKDIREMKRVGLFLFWSGFCVAMLGIFQYFFELSIVPQAVPPSSTFGHKNMAVHYIILSLPFGMAAFFYTSNRHYSWILLVASTCMVLYLFYTHTRSGWLAFASQILIWLICLCFKPKTFFKNKNKYIPAIIALCVVVLMIHVSPSGIRNPFNTPKIKDSISFINRLASNDKPILESKSSSGSSISIRLTAWRNSLEMIRQYPWIGVGMGNFQIHYPLFFRKIVEDAAFNEKNQMRNLHNDFLQIWVELGIIGVILFLWLLLLIIFTVKELIKNQKEDIIWLTALLSGLVGIMVIACFSFPLRRALPPVILMLFLGFLGVLRTSRRSYAVEAPRNVIIVGLILIVTLLVNACILHYRWINSDHFFAIMNTAEKRKDWQTIIPYGHKAVQLNPYRKKYNASLGLAYLKTGNTKQAIQEFNQVLQHYPYHTNALFNLGVACFQENLHDQALSTFKQYQRIRPNYHNLHYNLGHIYLHQKKYDHASKAFQKALHLKPGWKEATHYLDIAQKTLQDSKANAMKFQNIAIQFMKKKQYQKAIQAYDKAITFAPNDAALHFNKGSAYIEVQQYQSAKAAFKKAIACQPDWALAYKFLGVVLYEYLNEKQRAIGYLEKALQYDPMIKEYQKIQKVIDSDGR